MGGCHGLERRLYFISSYSCDFHLHIIFEKLQNTIEKGTTVEPRCWIFWLLICFFAFLNRESSLVSPRVTNGFQTTKWLRNCIDNDFTPIELKQSLALHQKMAVEVQIKNFCDLPNTTSPVRFFSSSSNNPADKKNNKESDKKQPSYEQINLAKFDYFIKF